VRFVVDDGRVWIEKQEQESSRGSDGLQRLRRARLRSRLSTDALLALTRGEDGPPAPTPNPEHGVAQGRPLWPIF
jgi:hypothetical protein